LFLRIVEQRTDTIHRFNDKHNKMQKQDESVHSSTGLEYTHYTVKNKLITFIQKRDKNTYKNYK